MLFHEGDVVRLRSGGPSMTVESQDSTYRDYRCRWFIGELPMTDNFSGELLELVREVGTSRTASNRKTANR